MPRADRVFRTEAIIIRRHEFSEFDRLLTIFTIDHGKMRVIAKGSRKLTGRQMGHVELFTRAKMMIARGRELHVVSQAEQIEPYMALGEDLERGAYAHYFVELVDHFSEFEEQNIALYNLLSASLGWLAKPEADIELTARFFEINLLQLVGFQPSLFTCAIGQEDLEPRSQYFSLYDGGVICPEHLVNTRAAMQISLNALKVLRYLQTREYDSIKPLRIENALKGELERILQNYIVHLLESKLKSVDFIRRLRKLGSDHPRQ